MCACVFTNTTGFHMLVILLVQTRVVRNLSGKGRVWIKNSRMVRFKMLNIFGKIQDITIAYYIR